MVKFLLGAVVLGVVAPVSAFAQVLKPDCAWVTSWGRGNGYDDARKGVPGTGRPGKIATVAAEATTGVVANESAEFQTVLAEFSGCYAAGYSDGVRQAGSLEDKIARKLGELHWWIYLTRAQIAGTWNRWTGVSAIDGVAGANVPRTANTTAASTGATNGASGAAPAGTARD